MKKTFGNRGGMLLCGALLIVLAGCSGTDEPTEQDDQQAESCQGKCDSFSESEKPERLELGDGPLGRCTMEPGEEVHTLTCRMSPLPDNDFVENVRVDLSTDDALTPGPAGNVAKISQDEFEEEKVETIEIRNCGSTRCEDKYYPFDIDARVTYDLAGNQRVQQQRTWTVEQPVGEGDWFGELPPTSFDVVEVVLWPHEQISEKWTEPETFGFEGSKIDVYFQHEFSTGDEETISFNHRYPYTALDHELVDVTQNTARIPVASSPADDAPTPQVTVTRAGPDLEEEMEVTSSIEGAGYYLINPDASVEPADAETLREKGVGQFGEQSGENESGGEDSSNGGEETQDAGGM